MTPTILLALVVTAVVVAGIALAKSIAAKRAKAPPAQIHRIDHACSSGGHAYVIYNTGWRCATCGNYVPRVDGELYGPADDGRVERRREPR